MQPAFTVACLFFNLLHTHFLESKQSPEVIINDNRSVKTDVDEQMDVDAGKLEIVDQPPAPSDDANRVASLRLEEKIMNEASGIIVSSPTTTTTTTVPPAATQHSQIVYRPPGHGPQHPPTNTSSTFVSQSTIGISTSGLSAAAVTGTQHPQPTMLQCEICGFSCASRFHFNCKYILKNFHAII
jgi:hypothetical protein